MERLRRGLIEQAPPVPRAVAEGAAACRDNIPMSANPYPLGSWERCDWDFGYEETQRCIEWEHQAEYLNEQFNPNYA